mmetsp:Transcript_3360/g.11828  ORF Transcript_3360/g.11828 Transcript_3360/m.11828 type:complete len:100 (-) Transcript_3360:118-417(-)
MRLTAMDLLLRQGSNLYTALHVAAERCSREHVEALLGHLPAEAREMRTSDGHTAYDLAEKRGKGEGAWRGARRRAQFEEEGAVIAAMLAPYRTVKSAAG